MNLAAVALLFVILALALLVWFTMNRPVKETPAPPPPATVIFSSPPVLLYGFSPDTIGRNISSSTGVLTVREESLVVSPLVSESPSTWNLVKRGGGVSLFSGGKWISGTVVTEEVALATVFQLTGPTRDGKIHELKAEMGYLSVSEEGEVIYADSGVNSEWIIVFGTCQSINRTPCS